MMRAMINIQPNNEILTMKQYLSLPQCQWKIQVSLLSCMKSQTCRGQKSTIKPRKKTFFHCFGFIFSALRDKPESVEYNGSLVKLVARVHQLCGNERCISKSGRLAAHLLAVDQDVFAMGPDGLHKERKRLKQ